jgi:hypothetical protein
MNAETIRSAEGSGGCGDGPSARLLVEEPSADRMVPDAEWHGTLGGYTNHKCRCAPCVKAKSAYNKQRYQCDKAAGLVGRKKCKCGCGKLAAKDRNYYRRHKFGSLRRKPCAYCGKMFVPLSNTTRYHTRTCAAQARIPHLREIGRHGNNSPKRIAARDARVSKAVGKLNPAQAYAKGKYNGWRAGYRAALAAIDRKDPRVLAWARSAGQSGVEAWARKSA